RDIRTPNIDRLATQGMRFTQCFQAAPMCSPTRHCIYTGLYPVKSGAYPNHTFAKAGTKSVVHYLKPLGYRVALSGKRHIAPQEVFPFEYSAQKNNPDFAAIEKLFAECKESNRPFCLFACSNEPHSPWNKGDPSRYDKDRVKLPPYFVDTEETRRNFVDYLAEITYYDGQVGRCLELLDKYKLAENTLVIVTSEQGSSFPFGKWTCYDTGLQVALVVRWPAKVKARSAANAMVQYVDVVPTLIEAAGGEPIKGLDGNAKMSKSLGNSPEPMDVIDRWGTDAFRFTLSMLSPPGRDIFFDESRLEMGRNFLNKIWQASRMITSAVDKNDAEIFGDGKSGPGAFADAWKSAHGSTLSFTPQLNWEDRWILSALGRCAADVEQSFSEWRLNDGASRIYDFFWHDFCDWYLELAKIRLYDDDEDRRTVLAVLLYVLGESLKFVHPLMPYVTEEIWETLPMTGGLLLENRYPRFVSALSNEDADAQMSLFREIVTAARNIRAQYNVNPGVRIPLRVKTPEGGEELIESAREGIVSLVRVDPLDVGPDMKKEKGSAMTPVGAYEVIVPLAGVVDLQSEYDRLKRERGKIEKDLDQVERKLANKNFVSRAKPEVVQKERDKYDRLSSDLEKLTESMEIIKS
ncbi:MAG: class I tRNA ligase family protein, partial [Candidatus Krumholzibacteriota bacterium]|nr:class I tRNA ligase family protein [Candidatus Krumholzibacteriota bacterium]